MLYCQSNRRDKVIIISRGFPTEENPLHGVFEFDQAKALTRVGYDVYLFALDYRSFRRKRPLGYRSFTKDGVTVFEISLPIGPIGFTLEKPLLRFGADLLMRKYNKIVADVPCVIHGHFLEPGFAAQHIAKKMNIPFVYTEHCSLVMQEEKRYVAHAQNLWRSADRTISVSTALRKKILEISEVESEVVGNVVDAKEFCNIQRLPHSGFRFVSVGSLVARKGHDLLLKAFSRLPNNIVLDIVGDGPERSNLEKAALSLGISSRVSFRGLRTRSEMAKIFSRSDCFVLASRDETFGVAFIEALASGLPVISTKCGGPEDFVNDTNGLSIPVDDLDALTNAMAQIISKCHLYNAEEISQAISNRFSPESIGKQLKQLYQFDHEDRESRSSPSH